MSSLDKAYDAYEKAVEQFVANPTEDNRNAMEIAQDEYIIMVRYGKKTPKKEAKEIK